ncbi:hypothetical protein Tco_0351047, partial [Tanacetum coccineum]
LYLYEFGQDNDNWPINDGVFGGGGPRGGGPEGRGGGGSRGGGGGGRRGGGGGGLRAGRGGRYGL